MAQSGRAGPGSPGRRTDQWLHLVEKTVRNHLPHEPKKRTMEGRIGAGNSWPTGPPSL
ncbi:hypothetical protein [Streptomyces scabiei]|uniref:hypothetical protein n=1 Tax=Streptomyces scabiei TaxID=1930 RepID=UPI0015C52015|nr:hypothetical protein [Streptomyces scabiei]